MYYSVIGIVCVTLIGFIANRVGLCLVRGVKLALDRQPGLLIAIILSGLWVGAYGILANFNDWSHPFMRYAFHPLFALGGFIFGLGASVNQGCSVSTMYYFARGNLSMLFTMFGWFLGWCLWLSLSMTNTLPIEYTVLPPIGDTVLTVLFLLSVICTILMLIIFPNESDRWLGISIIGLLVGVLFYIEPSWAPSRLIQDMGNSLIDNTPAPSGYRISLVIMLMVGMWLSVLLLRNVKLRWPTRHKIVRHSLAGLMMGGGGAMALGGNDSQILLGLPVLSMGAIVTVLFMCIGIAVEQILYRQGKLFYQKR